MNFTLAIIKPDAIRKKNVGELISIIEDNDFLIFDMMVKTFKKEEAEEFYSVHKDKDFYERLVNFMCSGPCVPIKLYRNGDCINAWRDLMVSIRAAYSGIPKHENAVHGSDSELSAKRELKMIFGSYNKDLVVDSIA